MLLHGRVDMVQKRFIPGNARITSYNVCYTKLLRLIRDNNLKQIPGALVAGKGDHMQTFNMSLVSLIEQGLVTEQASLDAVDDAGQAKHVEGKVKVQVGNARITSYNVCYTKLLRGAAGFRPHRGHGRELQ